MSLEFARFCNHFHRPVSTTILLSDSHPVPHRNQVLPVSDGSDERKPRTARYMGVSALGFSEMFTVQ